MLNLQFRGGLTGMRAKITHKVGTHKRNENRFLPPQGGEDLSVGGKKGQEENSDAGEGRTTRKRREGSGIDYREEKLHDHI